jgi:mRNA interferase RelE/StbE
VSREVRLERTAEHDLDRLPREVQGRVIDRLAALAEDPWGPGTKPLQGNLRGLRAVRVGDFRISYHTEEPNLVRVFEISDRRNAYKRLGRDW